MRLLVRAFAVIAVLFVLAVGAALVLLPMFVRSEEFGARLRDAVRDSTGNELSWQELDVGLLPPRLLVEGAEVRSAADAEAPQLAAASIALRVAAAPLLQRELVIESLRLEGVTLRLSRSEDGVALPLVPVPGEAEVSEDASGDGFALAVREVVLAESRLLLEDRAVSPTVTWEIGDLEARLRGERFDAPLQVDLGGRLASGGRVSAAGTLTLGGPLDLEVKLEDVDLTPAAPYLGEDLRLTGRVTGRVGARGASLPPDRLDAHLDLADGAVAMDELSLRGPVVLDLELEGSLEVPQGSFEVDATGAELVYGSSFRKEPGSPATAKGRLVSAPGGRIGVDDVHVKIKNLDGRASYRPGRRGRLELDAPSFDIEGWDELLPALRGTEPRGRVALEGMVVQTDPLEIQGRIPLAGVKVRSEAGSDLELSGALTGQGSSLRSSDLVAHFAGQRIPMRLDVTRLDAEPRFELAARADDADGNALVSELTGKPDLLVGPVTLQADLAGPIGGDATLTETLLGRVDLAVGRGRLRGVSLLAGAFERLGSFGEAALLAGAIRGGRTVQRFYEDEFESITGSFRIGRGRAATDDLRLIYRNYTVDLRGSVGLADLGLDLTGQITIDEEIDAALAQSAQGGTGAPPQGRRKVIPLASVGGTLSSPRVQLTDEAMMRLASSYALGPGRGRIEDAIDERLGEGAGKTLLDALQGVLGPQPTRTGEPR